MFIGQRMRSDLAAGGGGGGGEVGGKEVRCGTRMILSTFALLVVVILILFLPSSWLVLYICCTPTPLFIYVHM